MLMTLMLLLFTDLGFIGGAQVGESGGEESEDEWNYIKVDKKSSEGLAAVTEEVSEILESPVQENSEIEENVSGKKLDRSNKFFQKNLHFSFKKSVITSKLSRLKLNSNLCRNLKALKLIRSNRNLRSVKPERTLSRRRRSLKKDTPKTLWKRICN
jgi:hypothetical protein